MKYPIRIIPRLDIKGPNLVKGIRMEGLRVLGRPEDFARLYYLDGADELIYMDVVASLYGRNNLTEIVERTAKEMFIPLTVGGGIRSISDIHSLLRAGADKVAINTAAIKNPELIRESSKVFGSQCIVVSIEAKKQLDGSYEAYTDNGRERTHVNVFDWAQKACDLGAGEILITSVDLDGTGKGYDIELIRKISTKLPIPVIACSGAGNSEHIISLIKDGKADAVSLASLFHYYYKEHTSLDKIKEEGNVEYLKKTSQIKNLAFGHIKPASIRDVKQSLIKAGITCRDLTRKITL